MWRIDASSKWWKLSTVILIFILSMPQSIFPIILADDASITPHTLYPNDYLIYELLLPNQQSNGPEYSEFDFFYSKLISNYTAGQIGDLTVLPDDTAYGVKVDSQNNIVICGATTQSNYPTLNAAYPAFGGEVDGFITKFTPEGNIIWSTFLGGTDEDGVNDITIDSQDNVIVTGVTLSSDFPVTSGAFNESYSGNQDVFISKLTSGGDLAWSTYVGGSETDGNLDVGANGGSSIAVDQNDNILISGPTGSTNFPIQTVINHFMGEVPETFIFQNS